MEEDAFLARGAVTSCKLPNWTRSDGDFSARETDIFCKILYKSFWS